MSHRRSVAGVALVMALLVVALATTAAIAMVSRQAFDVRRSENLLAMEQGLLYQQGIEGWSAQLLRRDRISNDTDGAWESWATDLPPLPVEGGQIAGHIDDMQGLFNLNSLWQNGKVDPLALERFKRLMMIAGVENYSADVAVDWIDSDIDATVPDGAEDATYLGARPPHRSANTLFTSVSELLATAKMSRDDYQRLVPFVTALPKVTPINVNTAPKEVLEALADGISENDAATLIEKRGQQGYKSVQEFLQQPVLAGRSVSANGLSVASNYFCVTSRIRIGVLENGYTAMIYRSNTGTARVIRRAQGNL